MMTIKEPLLIDLFCGAGGTSMGYQNAGFRVFGGWDIVPQPHYLWPFYQEDWKEGLKLAIQFGYADYEVLVHASPPCQKYSTMTKRWGKEVSDSHPDLVAEVREALIESKLPYVIENVQGAPLIYPTKLCGSMFGLGVRRHRLFETSFPVEQLHCSHKEQGQVVGVYGHSGGKSKRDGITFSSTDVWRQAMGIDWMTGKELALAVPPAYTEYIGWEYFRGQRTN